MKKGIYRKDLHDLINEIDVFSGSLLEDLRKGYFKGNKAAMQRARVNSTILAKLFKELRKTTIEDEKQSKRSK